MKTMTDFLEYAKSWVGYCEKESELNLGASMEYPEDFSKNAGNKNYTIFAKEFKKETGVNVQGLAWCDTFVDILFIKFFGKDKAKKMLGGFSAWTPASADNFKKILRWSIVPKVGAVVFFHNSERINHTGIVYHVDKDYIYTIEGNTKDGIDVVANGGKVCKKKYPRNFGKIAGYGIVEYPKSLSGWVKAHDLPWMYYDSNGNALKNQFLNYEGLTYYLDEKGYLKTGQFFVDEKRYVACDGGSFEGAILKSYDT